MTSLLVHTLSNSYCNFTSTLSSLDLSNTAMIATEILRQSAPGTFEQLDKNSLFILENGWAASTTRHYAAAVNRYFKFFQETKPYPFPATAEAIYGFILWCRENDSNNVVLSLTTKRYLTGLRMWHVLHDVKFPSLNTHRLRLLFKAGLVKEVSTKRKRTGLTLMDLHTIVTSLNSSTVDGIVAKGVLLTGFWGLARLGEITLNRDHPSIFIRRMDVSFNDTFTRAKIRIRMAKTAAPGEDQFLRITQQPNSLDPCQSLQHILRRVPGWPEDPLFPDLTGGRPISRETILKIIDDFKPATGPFWSGHSLRIGGASLKAHYGCSIKSLQTAGRWKSSCYKLYIRPYDKDMAKRTELLAKSLNKTTKS